LDLQRCHFEADKIKQISDIYHVLFVEKNTTSSALSKIEAMFEDTPEREAIVDFVRSSKAGIIKRPSKTSTDEDNPF
jgi:UDP-N-acetylglucosamine acyltransferase